MAHELAGALQQAARIRQLCAVKEPHVYVRSEYIDVAEGRISQTGNRAAVMQKLPAFVPAFSHHLKPLVRDGSQFTGVLFHPRIDGGIPLDGAVESQQFRSHRRSTSCEIYGYAHLTREDHQVASPTRAFFFCYNPKMTWIVGGWGGLLNWVAHPLAFGISKGAVFDF